MLFGIDILCLKAVFIACISIRSSLLSWIDSRSSPSCWLTFSHLHMFYGAINYYLFSSTSRVWVFCFVNMLTLTMSQSEDASTIAESTWIKLCKIDACSLNHPAAFGNHHFKIILSSPLSEHCLMWITSISFLHLFFIHGQVFRHCVQQNNGALLK